MHFIAKRTFAGFFLISSAYALATAVPSHSQGEKQPALPPDAAKIGEDLYRVGKMTVDLKAGTATCAGKINMRRGILEYLAVAPGGKVHESLLTVDVRPLHFQVALILLGLEPKGGLTVQGDEKAPKGSPVTLHVSWNRAGKPVKVRAEELVWNIDRKQPLASNAWVFSGSSVNDRGFVADEELSLVATYRDPAAIVNNVLPSGADDTVHKVNERIVPPLGTPVTLIASGKPGAVPMPRSTPEQRSASVPQSGTSHAREHGS